MIIFEPSQQSKLTVATMFCNGGMILDGDMCQHMQMLAE